MYETVEAQEGEIAAAIEEGRPHAAAAFQAGFDHLNRLRRIAPRAADELARLRTVIRRAMPAQTPENRRVLDGAPQHDPVPALLRAAGKRSASLGSWPELQRLDALAGEIERLEAMPAMRDVVALRSNIAIAAKRQTNVEIARWLAMALAPGDPIITNEGERLW